MKKVIKIGSILLLVVVIATLALTSVAFAADNGNGASYGESSNGEGPGLENCWGKNTEPGTGTCLGYSHGECSDGAGPGLENRWGKNAH
ncbi:hypothetical protein ACFLS8_00510 [Chloroflexota bacterium]